MAKNDRDYDNVFKTLKVTEYVNTIIMHITDGNKAEREVTRIMGGVVLEAPEKKYFDLKEKS